MLSYSRDNIEVVSRRPEKKSSKLSNIPLPDKRNIPYTAEFVPFLELCVECPSLPHLSKGSNAKYTSKWTIEEYIQYMGDTVEDVIKNFFKSLNVV